MKKFKFRLEKVLHHRKLIEMEKLRELTEKNNLVYQLEKKLELLSELERKNLLKQGEEIAAAELYLVGLFSVRLQEEIINTRIQIVRASEEAELARQVYLEAAKEAKALVTLREKKYQEYMHVIAKDEQIFLDELSIQRGNLINNMEE